MNNQKIVEEIKKLVENTHNNYELGEKLRKLYLKMILEDKK
jgi:uncharacterized protein YigA (DUF484 family)